MFNDIMQIKSSLAMAVMKEGINNGITNNK
jgi:hypothetical protein